MADNVAQANANWDVANTWSLGVPIAGQVVDLSTFAIDLNVDTPALAEIKTAGLGKINVNLTAGDRVITATVINAGTHTSGVIYVYGATNTLTVNTDEIIAGSATSAQGIKNNGTGHVIINGDCTGGVGGYTSGAYNVTTGTITINGISTGSGTNYSNGVFNVGGGIVTINNPGENAAVGGSGINSYGVYNNGAGTVNIVGDVVGGSSFSAWGAHNKIEAGTINITGNLIFTDGGAAPYGGFDPTIVAGSEYYIQLAGVKFPQQLLAAQVLRAIEHGDRTGTLASVNKLQGLL